MQQAVLTAFPMAKITATPMAVDQPVAALADPFAAFLQAMGQDSAPVDKSADLADDGSGGGGSPADQPVVLPACPVPLIAPPVLAAPAPPTAAPPDAAPPDLPQVAALPDQPLPRVAVQVQSPPPLVMTEQGGAQPVVAPPVVQDRVGGGVAVADPVAEPAPDPTTKTRPIGATPAPERPTPAPPQSDIPPTTPVAPMMPPVTPDQPLLVAAVTERPLPSGPAQPARKTGAAALPSADRPAPDLGKAEQPSPQPAAAAIAPVVQTASVSAPPVASPAPLPAVQVEAAITAPPPPVAAPPPPEPALSAVAERGEEVETTIDLPDLSDPPPAIADQPAVHLQGETTPNPAPAPHRADAPATPLALHLPPRIAPDLVAVAKTEPDQPVDLMLNPTELGQVRFEMVQKEGVLHVTLTVERPETLDLMRRNADQLAQEFRQAGFGATSFSFSGGGSAGSWAGQGGWAGPEPDLPQTLAYNAADLPTRLYAPQSGLNLRL